MIPGRAQSGRPDTASPARPSVDARTAGHAALPARRLQGDGADAEIRAVAAEVATAISYNGVAHVVMMTTPRDVEDFATGFSLSEGIIADAGEIHEIDSRMTDDGLLVDIRIPAERHRALLERRRNLVGQSGCGLCGLEELEDAIRPLPPLTSRPELSYAGAHAALDSLRDHQPLNAATGAVHAAAFVDRDGGILAAREDVGRHNALDKLIGHMARAGIDPTSGFVLLSSRCSYELVHKAVACGCPALVTVSAPTTLAVKLAEQARLTLIALARPDSMLCFSDPHGLFAGE